MNNEFSDENIVEEIGRLRRHLEATSITLEVAEKRRDLVILKFIVE